MVQQGACLSRDYYCSVKSDYKKGLTKQWKGKCDYQIKQNSGKENVFKHIFQGYILSKDKQSMISMTGYNVENSLGRGEKFHDITHTTVFG